MGNTKGSLYPGRPLRVLLGFVFVFCLFVYLVHTVQQWTDTEPAPAPEPEPEPPQQEPVQQDDGGCIGDDAEILW